MTGSRHSAGRALAARLVVGLEGLVPTTAELAWLAAHRPVGVILFGRNVTGPSQLAELCARLRAAVPGLQIMVDHEGGPVAQMAAAAGRPPAAWGLGALDDVDLTRAVCRQTAERLAALGVTRVLGPVADVLEHARNPVIGARAFGATAALCARHVAAAVRGYRDAGLQVCVKHWPGHGGTATDSHLSLEAKRVSGCREPFRAGLEAGADAVMVGHLPVALSLRGEPRLATLDADYLASTRSDLATAGVAPILVADDVTMGALREPMRQAGVARPDDLEQGLVDPGRLPAAWLQALAAAGCDLLLIRGIPWAALPLAGTVPIGPEPAWEPCPAGEPASDPGAWCEARSRLWAAADSDWADRHRELGWLDATTGDRWGAADQRSGEAFGARLAGLFAAVRRVEASQEAPGGHEGLSRLLVTSHRPLGPGALGGLAASAQGVALAMGHPSLGDDLRDFLGTGWRVGQVYDCDAADLAPKSVAPGQ